MWEFVFLALLYLVGSVLFFHGKDSGPSLVWPGWKLPFQGADLKQKALARTRMYRLHKSEQKWINFNKREISES